MIFNHSSCLRCNCKQIIFQNQFEFLQFHLQPGVEEGGGEQEHVGGEEEGKGIPERYNNAKMQMERYNDANPSIQRSILAQQFLGPQAKGHLGAGSYLRALEGLVAWSLLDVVSQLVGL